VAMIPPESLVYSLGLFHEAEHQIHMLNLERPRQQLGPVADDRDCNGQSLQTVTQIPWFAQTTKFWCLSVVPDR
jgi:hypothetical protein